MNEELEYKTVKIQWTSFEDLDSILNGLGQDRWEMVQIIYQISGPGAIEGVFVFKRKKGIW